MEEESKKRSGKVCFIIMILSVVLAIVMGLLFVISMITGIIADSTQFMRPVLSVVGLCAVVFLVTGGLAHIFVDFNNGKTWEKVAYIMTFPPFIVMFFLMMLTKTIINKVSDGSVSSDVQSSANNDVVINVDGRSVELRYLDTYKDGNQYQPGDAHVPNPYYNKYYRKYQEKAFGNGCYIWLSYDDGKTFIREEDAHPTFWK